MRNATATGSIPGRCSTSPSRSSPARDDTTFVIPPGLGDCRTLSGTLTVTRCGSLKNNAEADIYSGTIAMTVRAKGGKRHPVSGTWEAVIDLGR